jgi:hypothetical protein
MVFIFHIVLSPSVQAEARELTLVIVQVEDTLKLSHVQNFWDSLNYSTDTKQRFVGMNAALSQLARMSPDKDFVYLTQEPELAAGMAEMDFVNKNGFPRGQFMTYSSLSDKVIQTKMLRKIIKAYSPAQVILLSHNGGLDPEIFHEIAAEFRSIPFLQYIHVVYSTSSSSEMGSFLFPEQIGYVTAVELLVDWQLKRLTGFSEMSTLVKTLIPRVVAENSGAKGILEYAIPSFMSCDDFEWKWSVKSEYSFLVPLRDRLVDRCHSQFSFVGF